MDINKGFIGNAYYLLSMNKLWTKLVAMLVLMGLGQGQLFYCQVENCAACSFYNYCGACDNNYVMMIGDQGAPYCQAVTCTIDNCETCLVDNLCQVCSSGSFPQPDGSCGPQDMTQNCPSFCLACSEDQGCARCQAGFTLDNGKCFPTIEPPANCTLAFNSAMCQVCKEGNYLTLGYKCVEYSADILCQIENCYECSSNNSCMICGPGFTEIDGACVEHQCEIENCLDCVDNSTCIQCQPNYYLMDEVCILQTYPCSDPNCAQCASGADLCATCNPGYYRQEFYSSYESGTICLPVTPGMLTNPLANWNCQTLGMIPAAVESTLIYGCIQCNSGFWSVGGFCVAILQNSIECNVENCASCAMPNYCNVCEEGYYVPQGAGGICVMMYSPIPNCVWSTQKNKCEMCAEGYASINTWFCEPYNSEVTCQVAGCAFCLDDNICQQCQSGFSEINDGGEITCEAVCDVENCKVCGDDNSTCFLCQYGYMLDSNDTECITDELDGVYCTENFGQLCDTCSSLKCLSCESGYTYDPYTESCCNTGSGSQFSNTLVANCLKTRSPCNSTCVQCQKGYIMEDGNCVNFPCSIQNCAFCYRSDSCIVCSQGYTLNAGTNVCQQYVAPLQQDCPNSQYCTECSGGVCTACVNGYQLYEGLCVCNFQNCLECMGGAFCTNCTFPAIPAFENGGGCIPRYTVSLCEVDNCAECFSENQCSLCAVGFYLDETGVCMQNNCEDPQCELCDRTSTFCYLCSEGYMPDQLFGKNCVEIPQNYSCAVQGCAVCDLQDENYCDVCDEQYVEEGQGCTKIQCSQNCIFCIQEDTCTLCAPGFFLRQTEGNCQPHDDNSTVCTSIENCLFCVDNPDVNELQCLTCGIGFQPSEDSLSCVPQECDIWGCQICTNDIIPPQDDNSHQYLTTKQCLLCQQGYFRNSYLQCVSYSPEPSESTCKGIYNCIYCANNQSCSLCAEGWLEMDGLCATNTYCGVDNCAWCSNPTTCLKCADQYIISSSGDSCIPDCQIEYCEVCTDLTHCTTCSSPFLQSDDNTKCVCKESYVEANGTCICDEGFKEFGGQCISCDIPYCNYCKSADVCADCLSDFQLQAAEGICQCPVDYTEYDETCIECSIDFCTLCQTANVCESCLGDLIVVTGQDSNGQNASLCGCPETYEQINSTCQCPTGTTENNGVCYSCQIDYCDLCSADDFCETNSCQDSFTNNNGTCVCPEGTNIYNGVCYLCGINNCDSCHEDSVCFECNYPFEVNQNGESCSCPETFVPQNGDTCVCPTGKFNDSSSNNTCIACGEVMEYCVECQTQDLCDTCQNPFVRNVNNSGCQCPESYIQNGDNCVCEEGYSDYQGVCYDCTQVDYCSSCSNTNFCDQCLEGFIKNPNGDGTCICPDVSYSIVDNTCICPSLTTEYNSSCVACDIELCELCQEDSVCADCQDPFVPSASGCVCPDTFIRDGNTCICPDGYYLHEGTVCLVCDIENCHSCVSVDECEMCDATFELNSNNTACQCPPTFQLSIAADNSSQLCVCPAGTNEFEGACVQCQVDYCNFCQQDNICFDCFDSFFFNDVNNVCQCRDESYQIVNQETCQCPSNTIQYQQTCIVCEIEYCEYCEEPNVCGQCFSTFAPVNDSEGTSACQCSEGQKIWNDTCVDCNIENCQYCIQPGICEQCAATFVYIGGNNVCRCPDTYTLSQADMTCYECSIDFCELCTETSICNTCLGDLIPTNIENPDVQNQTISVCACPPTYEVVNSNETECQCPASTTENNGVCYLCDIQWCSNCLEDSVCSTCDDTFELNTESNTCVCPSGTTFYQGKCYDCSINFCNLCQVDSFCAQCAAPFLVNETSGECQCPETFSLNNENVCVCQAGEFNLSSSQTCESCSEYIQYCGECTSETVCDVCSEPFQTSTPDANGAVSCVCPQTYLNQNDNCVCPDGFSDFEGVCYDCNNAEHCLSCSGTNFCQQCHSNFVINNGTCVCRDDTYIVENNECMCPSQTTEYNNSCVTCDIQYCTLCMEDSMCSTCQEPFVVSNDELSCTCPATYVRNGDNCVCPTGFYENSVSELCLECQLDYCQQCASNTSCQTCQTNFILTEDNQCACQTTYQPINGSCQCPAGTIEHQNVCYQCNSVDYCNYCTSNNFCGSCFDGFVLNGTSGTCGCIDETFVVVNGNQCACPTNTKQFNNTCISCNIANCVYCEESGVCEECYSGFTLSAAGNSCTCPVTFVIVASSTNSGQTVCQCPSGTFNVSNMCTSCGVANCLTCGSASTCQTCKTTFHLSANQQICSCPDSTFTVSGGQCVCPTNTTLFNNNTCVACSIQYCQLCQEAGVCETCLSTFLKVNNTCVCNSPFVVINNVCGCPINQTEFQGQCIQCEVDGCAFCQQSNICSTCSSTYVLVNNSVCQCPTGFTEYQGACYNCSNAQYCEICSGAGFCAQCQASFQINATTGTCSCPIQTTLFNNTCVECNIDNCALCRQSNVCFSCQANYTQNENYCLECLIGNCQQCEVENVCGVCSNGLQVSSNGNTCVLCQIENCVLCSGNNVCSACQGNFQLSASQTSCITCTQVPGCLACSVDNVCSQCEPGYTINLANNSCDVCSYPCSTCVTGNLSKCATCAAPYSSQPNSNGQCYTCSVPNCVTCSSTNSSQCTSCSSGYRLLQSNSTCQLACTSNLCTSCSDPAICTACVSGYVPSGNTCIQCQNTPACISCNVTNLGQCTACNTGYYLQNSSCLTCPSNCQTCSSNGQCQTFKASTKQFGIRINNQTVPAVCDSGCTKCSNEDPSRCIVCSSGFALQTDNTCLPCQSPCKTCSSNNASSCLSCYGNAFLDTATNACNKCTPTSNCLTCSQSNLTQCLTCPYGYSLSNSSTCIKGCPNNCLSCSSALVCNLCIEGYAPNTNGTCLPCLSNCRECSSQANGVCLSCGPGFYLNSNEVCTVCEASFCQTCSSIGCSQCLPGFTLTPAFTCAKNCKSPCSTCSETNPNSCTSCLAGYTYDQTTSSCNAVVTCTDGCNICPLGYVLSQLQCLQCSGNCTRCQANSLSTCTACPDGAYVFNGSCISCPVGCETCSSSENCLSCESGYTPLVEDVSTSMSCVACDFPCEECVGNSGTCTECAAGFTLTGWKCVSNFHFKIQLVFAVNPDVFYQNYQLFLTQITNALSASNFDIISMNNIQQGSTIINSTVNTLASSDSNEASTQFNSLESALTTGKSINGMQIESSSISAEGGTLAVQTSGPNLSLILGISIPCAVILIGIIAFCVFKKTRSRPPYEESDTNRHVREEFELTNNIGGGI